MRFRNFVWIWLLGALLLFLEGGCASDPLPGEAALDAPRPPTWVQGVKIVTSQPGPYGLTDAMLANAGFAITAADRPRLTLTRSGKPIPLGLTGDEAGHLFFWAAAPDSRYMQQAVYLLTLSDHPLRPISIVSTPLAGPDLRSYSTTITLEENNRYSPTAPDGEHWFWQRLIAPDALDISISLPGAMPNAGRLTVDLWASSANSANPDHQLRLTVNEQIVGDFQWDGQGRKDIVADLPPGILMDGENQIRVESPGDLAIAAEVLFVDKVSLHYERAVDSASGWMDLYGQGRVISLSNQPTPPMILDVTDPLGWGTVDAEFNRPKQRWGLSAIADHHYAVVTDLDQMLTPSELTAWPTGPDLHQMSGVDYIAIGPPDLLTAVAPLLAWRESQGLSTLAVESGTLYDQFNHGVADPLAIPAFLAYAAANWPQPPTYLLLMGDATYDPQGYVAEAAGNRLPTLLVETVHGGETASDVLLGDWDADGLPDLAVGRIPARTPEQVTHVVQKVLDYEQHPPGGGWQKRVIAVADGTEAGFQQAAQRFLDRVPAPLTSTLVSPMGGDPEGSKAVIRELEQGSLLTAYFGHGSVGQWGQDRLFTVQQAQKLANGPRLSIVINMTCLTGLFTHPSISSLAEELLWRQDGGAVAVLAPTSLTIAYDQSYLSDPLIDGLLADSKHTLGQALLAAQRQVPLDSPGSRDVLYTFLLFGDPALHPLSPQ